MPELDAGSGAGGKLPVVPGVVGSPWAQDAQAFGVGSVTVTSHRRQRFGQHLVHKIGAAGHDEALNRSLGAIIRLL